MAELLETELPCSAQEEALDRESLVSCNGGVLSAVSPTLPLMAGRRHELEWREDLAHAHEAGASVHCYQLLEHDPLGTIAFEWQANTWVHHANASIAAVSELEVLATEVSAIEVDRTGMRNIDDTNPLLQKVYLAGTTAVLHGYLAVQHLCERVECVTKATPDDEEGVIVRLRACTDPLGISPSKLQHYDAFAEVVRIRHAIEHPKATTSYNGAPGGWDQVPLAWMLSNRSGTTLENFHAWFEELINSWDAWQAAQPEQPGTLTVGMRGVASKRPYKKPPKSST